MMDGVCAFTCVCEEDSVWVLQYLAEVERLGVPFYVYLDRYEGESKQLLTGHRMCAGVVESDSSISEFSEMHKQRVLDLVMTEGYSWAVAWDVDETWEPDLLDRLSLDDQYDVIGCHWIITWGVSGRSEGGRGIPRERTKG